MVATRSFQDIRNKRNGIRYLDGTLIDGWPRIDDSSWPDTIGRELRGYRSRGTAEEVKDQQLGRIREMQVVYGLWQKIIDGRKGGRVVQESNTFKTSKHQWDIEDRECDHRSSQQRIQDLPWPLTGCQVTTESSITPTFLINSPRFPSQDLFLLSPPPPCMLLAQPPPQRSSSTLTLKPSRSTPNSARPHGRA